VHAKVKNRMRKVLVGAAKNYNSHSKSPNNTHIFAWETAFKHSCALESYRDRFVGWAVWAGLVILQHTSGIGRFSCWWVMCEELYIANATTRQSTVRRRWSMARGARSVSTPAWGLSQAGCCVRAAVVGVMVGVSSGSSSCLFFSVVGRRSSAAQEAGGGRESRKEKGDRLNLNLRCWWEGRVGWSLTFWHLWHMWDVTTLVPLFRNISLNIGDVSMMYITIITR